jgi:hypothetical protein
MKTDLTEEGAFPVNELAAILSRIDAKIQNAKALNGGFDALMVKVESIEDSQQQMVNQIEKLSQSMYDPDEGIFARHKELATWQQYRDKEARDQVAAAAVHDKREDDQDAKIDEIIVKVDSLSKWRASITSTFLWVFSGAAAGLGGLGLKLLYTYLTGNILH